MWTDGFESRERGLVEVEIKIGTRNNRFWVLTEMGLDGLAGVSPNQFKFLDMGDRGVGLVQAEHFPKVLVMCIAYPIRTVRSD